MNHIQRTDYLQRIERGIESSRIVALLGPRQCGKTTLAKEFAARASAPIAFFDLENPRDLARLSEPMIALERLEGVVIIDEIQLRPDLFPLLRVLADRNPLPCRFLILGSASPDIVSGVSETLAGRIHFVNVAGLSLGEVGAERQESLWLRGGFPEAFGSASDSAAFQWLEDFVLTFLQRDLPQLGIRVPAEQMRRFWTMLAHYHGNTWNASEISRSLGLTHKTIRHYADILAGAFMVRLLPPWFENVGKRLVKSPKAYLRDTGILHSLLGIRSQVERDSHPKLGSSWEGFALETIIQSHQAESQSYFWAAHSGAELDLLIIRGNKKIGFEFKYADAPKLTPSMRSAQSDLALDALYVVHPSEQTYPLSPQATVLSLEAATQLDI